MCNLEGLGCAGSTGSLGTQDMGKPARVPALPGRRGDELWASEGRQGCRRSRGSECLLGLSTFGGLGGGSKAHCVEEAKRLGSPGSAGISAGLGKPQAHRLDPAGASPEVTRDEAKPYPCGRNSTRRRKGAKTQGRARKSPSAEGSPHTPTSDPDAPW